MRMVKSVYQFLQKTLLSGQASMWVVVGLLIGIAAGVGSLVLYNLIGLIGRLLLTGLSGFTAPLPGVAGGGASVPAVTSRLLILASTTAGGLISGLLVYLLAPGTEGLGINAAINAFHNLTAKIRNRTPAVKLLASAAVIGSGGSAGRDGPVALISAVFGSFLADRLGLDDHDRRIVMASAIGAGFGSIFMAPIGGAIMSTEILYRKDFEVEALIPAITASIVGYAIFGFQFHYRPLFTTAASSFFFVDAHSILVYALIGVVAGFGGRLYIKLFDLIHRGFARLRAIPSYLRPAIGGLLVGVIGAFFPQVLGLGYGWVQLILNGALMSAPHALPLVLFFLALFFLKIVATSLTIGSGGSGGVFAPSLVTGAFLGACLGIILHAFFPSVSVAEATIVTMIAFFAGVSKAPVSMLIMGTEMAGGLDMFLPLMLATGAAYLASGTTDSIYSAQVLDRLHSPAHLGDYREDILLRVKISDSMRRDFLTAPEDTALGELSRALKSDHCDGVIVLHGGAPAGYVTRRRIQSSGSSPNAQVSELIGAKPVTIDARESAREALALLPPDPAEKLVVVDGTQVVGTLGFPELADAYEGAFRRHKFNQMRRRH